MTQWQPFYSMSPPKLWKQCPPSDTLPLSSTKDGFEGSRPPGVGERPRSAPYFFVPQSFQAWVGYLSAICEGPDACKKDEVCVKPGLCRCKPGFFGAHCTSREFSRLGKGSGQNWVRGRKQAKQVER